MFYQYAISLIICILLSPKSLAMEKRVSIKESLPQHLSPYSYQQSINNLCIQWQIKKVPKPDKEMQIDEEQCKTMYQMACELNQISPNQKTYSIKPVNSSTGKAGIRKDEFIKQKVIPTIAKLLAIQIWLKSLNDLQKYCFQQKEAKINALRHSISQGISAPSAEGISISTEEFRILVQKMIGHWNPYFKKENLKYLQSHSGEMNNQLCRLAYAKALDLGINSHKADANIEIHVKTAISSLLRAIEWLELQEIPQSQRFSTPQPSRVLSVDSIPQTSQIRAKRIHSWNFIRRSNQ